MYAALEPLYIMHVPMCICICIKCMFPAHPQISVSFGVGECIAEPYLTHGTICLQVAGCVGWYCCYLCNWVGGEDDDDDD